MVKKTNRLTRSPEATILANIQPATAFAITGGIYLFGN